MADMFDPTLSADEAVSRLVVFQTGGHPPDVVEAVRVVLEDRERLKAVAAHARHVRDCQRRYFKDRTDTALQESKGAERKLDAMLKD